MNKIFTAVVLLLSLAGTAFAQYPNKPIRLVVGFPPGGSADPTARALAAPLQDQLAQPVVVENRPGGDSAIGAEMVSKSAPDGYTLFYGSSSAMTAAVMLRKVPPYDPLKDFTPIGMVGRAMTFLYVNPEVPAKTLKEFIAYVKANPGKVNYGTGNPLSILYNAQLNGATGMDMIHIPYKGEGTVTPDLIAGRVQQSCLSSPGAISLAKDGRLRALAVLADRRAPILPDVPTIAEAGVPEVTTRHWAGIFGPPGMPRPVVERLNKEINVALKNARLLDQFERYGYAAEGSTPERLLEINRDDLALWKRLVKEANIPLE